MYSGPENSQSLLAWLDDRPSAMEPYDRVGICWNAAAWPFHFKEGKPMNKEQAEGAAQKAAGEAKAAIGKAAGVRKIEAEGVAEKVAGSAKQAFGDVKAAIHKATK
jgi:uncharacterized protein YjbJ (UPF0337 family)